MESDMSAYHLQVILEPAAALSLHIFQLIFFCASIFGFFSFYYPFYPYLDVFILIG
jgi:hypothetical protein